MAQAQAVRRSPPGSGLASDARRDRLDAASGVLFATLLLVAIALPGPPPRADDPALVVARVFVAKRGQILAGVVLTGMAVAAYVWFLGAVRDSLERTRSAASGPMMAACGGGLVGAVLMLFGMVIFGGAAFSTSTLEDAVLVRALNDVGMVAIAASKFGFAVFAFAASRAGARSGVLPRSLSMLGVASGCALLASAGCVMVSAGPLQLGGPVDLGGALPAFVWMIALSVFLMRNPRPASAGPAPPR
jgi:hypothetical protein